MSVEVIRNDITNESCYVYTHKSGIKVHVLPKPEFSSAAAYFGTRYGSIDTTFKTDKDAEFTTVPEGIAHYLEHKLFENEDCDAFERFAKTGAYSNAYTSFDQTCYLFSCSENFYDSLKILLDFVQSPYFTKETVQKEQGIIGQEISMYDDDPDWSVLFNLLRAMYIKHPVRIDIAGTVESIAQITPELLYQCYNTFYNLNNMFICISGNVDPEKVFAICDEMLKSTEPVSVIRADVDEPDNVGEKYVEHNLPVAMPMFAIGYKQHCVGVKSDKETTAAEIIRKMLFGNDSPLYEQLLDKELINDSFSSEYFCGHGFASTLVEGESGDPVEVKRIIDEYIAGLLENGLCEKSFERAKKSLLGELITSFDEPVNIPRMMVSAVMNNDGIFDCIDSAKNMTFDFVSDYFRQMFNIENSALSVVKPR